MLSPDFDLVNRVFVRLADREESDGPDSINDIERVVLLVWHAAGIIGNGGFHYFLECGLPLRSTAEAYSRIGVESAAAILFRLLDLFPRQHVPSDWDERMEFVEHLCDRNRDLFDRWEGDYYNTEALMGQQLAGWIRVHDDVFHSAGIS
ncbi:MAG: DUF4375 domain-containing protein [Chthoniobacteraceae bacterium]